MLALTKPRKVHILHKKRLHEEGFLACRGLRQGNPLSSGLFNVFASLMATILEEVSGGNVISRRRDTARSIPGIRYH